MFGTRKTLLVAALLLGAHSAGAQPIDTYVRIFHSSLSGGQRGQLIPVGVGFRATAEQMLRTAGVPADADVRHVVELMADDASRKRIESAKALKTRKGRWVSSFLVDLHIDGAAESFPPDVHDSMLPDKPRMVFLQQGSKGLKAAVDEYQKRTRKGPRRAAVLDVLLVALGSPELVPPVGQHASTGGTCVMGFGECAPIIEVLR